jgi:hypothetical protein
MYTARSPGVRTIGTTGTRTEGAYPQTGSSGRRFGDEIIPGTDPQTRIKSMSDHGRPTIRGSHKTRDPGPGTILHVDLVEAAVIGIRAESETQFFPRSSSERLFPVDS